MTIVIALAVIVAVMACLAFTNIGRMLLRDVRGAVTSSLLAGGNYGLDGPAGPATDVLRMRYLTMEVVLAAGTVSEVLPDAAAQGLEEGPAWTTQLKTAGGVPGWLSVSYVKATKTVTVSSTNAGDTSTVNVTYLAPIG